MAPSPPGFVLHSGVPLPGAPVPGGTREGGGGRCAGAAPAGTRGVRRESGAHSARARLTRDLCPADWAATRTSHGLGGGGGAVVVLALLSLNNSNSPNSQGNPLPWSGAG